MKITVLNGSPRPSGNTAAMVESFKNGAESKGHIVNVVNIGTMKINGCIACEYCHNNGNGKCIQQDEMQSLYPYINDSDMLVIASPVYYWSFSGQTQSVITRFYCLGRPNPRKYAMLLSSGSPEVYDAPISQYKDILSFFGAQDMGIITAYGSQNKSEAKLKECFDFGASL